MEWDSISTTGTAGGATETPMAPKGVFDEARVSYNPGQNKLLARSYINNVNPWKN